MASVARIRGSVRLTGTATAAMRAPALGCATLVADLAAVDRMSHCLALSGPDLRVMVEESVSDYRGLLTRQTAEARGILRELLVDRVLYNRSCTL